MTANKIIQIIAVMLTTPVTSRPRPENARPRFSRPSPKFFDLKV
jgi:hypothetical protein